MRIRESKTTAWLAVIIMTILIIVAMCFHWVGEWWEYSVLFLGFMAAFCHLAAVLLYKMSKLASKKLDNASLVFAIAAIIDLIVIFILNFIEFY